MGKEKSVDKADQPAAKAPEAPLGGPGKDAKKAKEGKKTPARQRQNLFDVLPPYMAGQVPAQSSEPPQKKARTETVVSGILRAAAIRQRAAHVRPSVLQRAAPALPVDFLAASVVHTDPSVEAPEPFVFDEDGQDFEEEDTEEYEDPEVGHLEFDEDICNDDDDDMGPDPLLGAPSLPPPSDEFSASALLANLLAAEGEVQGPEAPRDIADVTNGIWLSLQKELSKVYEKHVRPSNVYTYKVDINEEILATLTKPAKLRDMKLRAAQGAVAGASNIIVKTLTSLSALESASDHQALVALLEGILQSTVDQLKLLSHANMTLNNLRRDFIRPSLNQKYQGLCKETPTTQSNLLFGDRFAERVRALSQAVQIGRTPQYGQYGAGARRGRYGQYGRGGRGYGRGRGNFLGKRYKPINLKSENTCTITMSKSSVQCITLSESYDQIIVSKSHVDNYNSTIAHSHVMSSDFRQASAAQGARPREATVPGSPAESVTSNQEPSHEPAMVGELPKIDINYWPVYKAGRISECVDRWRDITSDRVILNLVKAMTIDFDEIPEQNSPVFQKKFEASERRYLHSEIQTMQQMQVIEVVRHCPGEYVSPIFLVPKKQAGKYRLILNLKRLNLDVEYHHFQMDTIESTLKLVTPGCYMMSIDLKDAYYSIKVHEKFRKFLRFEFEGKLYQFTCLPNGLSSGPRIFTKILKVPLTYLRETYGIVNSAHIDDIFVKDENKQACLMSGYNSTNLLQPLGFTISPKSILEPTRQLDHLGFFIDSILMRVSLPTEKVENIVECIEDCLEHNLEGTLNIRLVSTVLGKLEATRHGNRFAKLYTKRLTIDKNRALAQNRYDFDKLMQISPCVIDDLRWCIQNLSTVYAPIFVGQPDEVIYTDASLAGWGCHVPNTDLRFGGRWSDSEQSKHINELELLAIYFSLKATCRHFYHIHLRVMTDNMTSMLCINNQGSVRSIKCNNLTRQIWDWALEHDVWLSAAHVPGVDNEIADQESRKFADESEWMLSHDVFQSICSAFGTPDIDLFASRLNAQLGNFCSWKPDPEAAFIDSFSISWQNRYGYAFPPFAIIPGVLQKIKMEGASVILVVPKWPTKPWFSFMQKMLVCDPIEIKVTKCNLILPSRLRNREGPQQHPLTGRLRLLVCKLSGRC